MLNPECVDYSQGKVKIVFTDDNVDVCVTVYLTVDDAFRLSQMLLDKTNLPAREKRRGRHDPYISTF